MTEAELDAVAEALGIELPMVYREFQATYPELLRSTQAADFEVLSDPDRLVSLNKLIERSHIRGWRDSFFAIGESGCGDYYAIDLDEDDGEVYFWNHELARVDEEEGFSSLVEYAGQFLNMYRRLDPRAD